jgi:choice-of-anchor B domain-containing protein
MHRILVATRGLLLAPALTTVLLSAQGQNVQLLAHVDRFPGGTASSNNYAGIYGAAIQGRELAIVTARTGTLIYDCTTPSNPIEVAFIPGPGPSGSGYFWREAQVRGTYAYISSEHGPIQVIDLSNPAAPSLVGTFAATAHTIAIDQDSGVLVASGGSGRGLVLYDLNANPVSPPQLSRRSTPYVHDCLPVRGYVYAAEMFDGTFGIVDVRNPSAPVTVSRTATPSAFPHNVAVDDDETIAIVTEERRGDCLAVYDITNKAAPRLLTRWCSPNGATVHNVFLIGKVAHLACYADGYWALDFSDPANPRTIGRYDTSSFANNNYNGCWGAYPFQPSGVVYLSDMQSGFFIVEPTAGVPHLYGDATAGLGGTTPRIDYANGHAQVGNPNFALVADRTAGAVPVAFLLASAGASTPFFGIDLLVDPQALWGAFQVNASGTPGSAGSGSATLPLPLPNVPGLAGLTLHAQAVPVDSAGPAGLAATRGFRVTIAP